MTTPVAASALILFGHGSRDPLWHKPMQAVAERMRELAADVTVQCAYLELTEPDLTTCAEQLIDQGIQAITIVPMFLGVGRHAREDLPRLVQALQARHPQVRLKLLDAVGEDARVIELLARLALDAA
ncbi:MAG: CbiX/SirB N-terminal domain-containing protein [Hylemonella sp.]|nr:CbiX/SirB N-terminal domain-containing protein [Hylemonella sp.]MDH5708981.1 CbiX/SirB N-terminal domain-containing protein [Hylemonella sp.]